MSDLRMLAYLGDAVYEVGVRKYILDLGVTDPKEANRLALSFVTATAQARALKEILSHLTEEEQDICRRGRNLKCDHAPKSASFAEYRLATALEILIGFLYENRHHQRLDDIFLLIFTYLLPQKQENLENL